MTAAVSARVLERVSSLTPLGVRFWDPLLDTQVLDGLEVRAWPHEAAGVLPRAAMRTASGIYAFFGLPGTRDFETGALDPFAPPSPAIERRFVVDVRDAARRYVDVAFGVTLPLGARGPFPIPEDGAGSDERVPGLFLFSSPARQRPSWFGAVHGELACAPDGAAPAAHARLTVTDPNGEVWHGVADAAGRFTVWLAYPAIEQVPVASPQPTLGLALNDRVWPVRLSVFFQPGVLRPLPGTTTPDYESVLTQASALVWDRVGGSPGPFWQGELRFGCDVNARSGGETRLLVSPRSSSP